MNAKSYLKLHQPAQFLALDEDRLFIRLQGAQFLLRGTGLADLARLLPFLKGHHCAEDIVTALQDTYSPSGIRRTLDLLIQRQCAGPGTFPPPKAVSGSAPELRISWMTSPELFAQLPASWRDQPNTIRIDPPVDTAPWSFQRYLALPKPADPKEGETHACDMFQNCDLAVWVAEDVSFGMIQKVADLARKAHTPLLLGFSTPLGFEWLPLFGRHLPCFSCYLDTEFGSMVGTTPVLPSFSALRTVPIASAHRDFAIHFLAQKVLEFQAKPGEVFTSQRWEWATQAIVDRPARRQNSCSNCQNPWPKEPPQGRALDQPKTIGIVGGGTAGYLTALALRSKHPHLKVTLVESPRVPVIGVGEATTPLMLQFLHVDLAIDIVDFFQQVAPTLKLGIQFDWGHPAPWSFPYPFGPMDTLQASLWGNGLQHLSQAGSHMGAGTIPLWQQDGSWETQWDCNTAYHLDNRKFVTFLRETANARGVIHKSAHIQAVRTTEDGKRIQHLETEAGETLTFDIFVDCTGFQALLLKALQSPFVSFSKTLFTDAAVIGKIPDAGYTPPFTRATTLSAGWCWNTPQRDAHHCGYVYASSFISATDAEAEMRRLLPQIGPLKHLSFKTGRHHHFFRGNVVAMGNAYGFVEPLESTALHMLIRQIGWFVQSLNQGDSTAQLNTRVGAHWDYLAWFLGLHYRYNRRMDTPFWRACHQNVDLTRFAHLIDAFRQGGPLVQQPELWQSFRIPDPLWGPEGVDLLLLAQGLKPALSSIPEASSQWQQRQQHQISRANTALSQAQALREMDDHPQLIRQLENCFKNRGPAFG